MTNTTAMQTHLIDLPDGRTLAVGETGDASGPVVVLLPSAPGSRLIDPDPAATAAAGVRLLTIDRPGYGASSPLAEGAVPSVADAADDLAFALAALGITDVAVAGWSSGGRYALALAARHPELVRSAALIATPAPDDEVPWIQEQHRPMLAEMRADPAGGVIGIAQAFAPIAADPDLFLNQVGDGDADVAALAADPEMRDRAQAMLVEAFRPGVVGVATDIVACNVVDGGFDASAVGAPVALFYGDADVAVPPPHGEYWERVLAESTLHVVPGGGHFIALSHWGEVLAALAAAETGDED